MSDETTTQETATGPRATRTVETVDSVEPELAQYVRRSALLLDPSFPQSGDRGPKERGQWTNDDQTITYMQQVEELDGDKRGIRTIRLLRHRLPGEPNEGALRVIAVGLANDAVLEVRWNIIVSATEVRGQDAELKVDGANKDKCIADFRECFGVPLS
jgi:hypothetical protein